MMKVALLCLVYVISTFTLVEGQFPKVCITAESLRSKTCCPTPPGFSDPCGGTGRGECNALKGPKWSVIYEHYNNDHDQDDRNNWPTLFFKRACNCTPPFSGYDCSKCEFGYHGVKCSERVTLVRRNFMKMPQDDKDNYMRYIQLSRDRQSDYVVAKTFYNKINDSLGKGMDPALHFANVSVYDLFVWEHYYAARDTFLNDGNTNKDIDFAHEGQGFPTWHRLYLLSWERALQDISGNYTFALPFWDWTENNFGEICTSDLLGANTGPNNTVVGKNLVSWYMICTNDQVSKIEESGTKICDPTIHTTAGLTRNPGVKASTLPTSDDVDFTLRFDSYDFPPHGKSSSCSFRNLLEGFISIDTGFYSPKVHSMHNQVHLYVGGAMADVPAASNDPIFFLHHSFVDRIFEKWLRKYKKVASQLTETGAPIGHNREDPIVPLFPVKTHEQMFKKSFALGYDYEEIDGNGKSPNDGKQDCQSGLGNCLNICPASNTYSSARISTQQPRAWFIAIVWCGKVISLFH